MNESLGFTICFILESKYKEIYNLPSNWNKIDLSTKCELLGKALNNEKKIEDLKDFKELNIQS